ncbi:MAG: fibronectin type III domain-containing protein [Myxococcales bacterium]|nr:fibronectin type III domain-containing protein [Myxococcales bacterium]
MRRLVLLGLVLLGCSAGQETFLDGGNTTPPDGGSSSGGDQQAPMFAGATAAMSSPNAVTVTWNAASDNVSAASQITYLVYQATAAGGQSFAQPTATSAPGATSLSIGKLATRTAYFFVVRAKDEAGNVDSNKVEVSATTPATSDMMAPTFAGLSTATASGTSIQLSWNAASDGVTPAAQMVYLVYQAQSTRGQSFTMPSYTTAPGQTSLAVTGLTPGQAYYFVVRAQDQAGNIDGNSVERSATTTAPSFMRDVQPIWQANCTGGGCHSGMRSAENLNLDTAATSYAGLVNVSSTQCAMNKRVAPAQPDQSYLLWKLAGTGPCFGGSRMPKSGPLPVGQIATIRAWIQAGAPNN